jgi:GTP cyclohydrolase IA
VLAATHQICHRRRIVTDTKFGAILQTTSAAHHSLPYARASSRRPRLAAAAFAQEMGFSKRKSPSACDGGETTSLDGSGSGTGSCASAGAAPSSMAAADSDTVVALTTEQPPAKKPRKRLSHDERLARITGAMRTILDCLDDDPNREGLQKTPARYAKAILDLTSGYSLSPAEVLGDAEFHENHTEMVLIREIDVFSHCEHHLLPFHGTCHISYIPNGTVVGLSKIARIVDLYARRLQVQERLTSQIADAISVATGARGVMVYVSCTHMCMVMRGVRKVNAATITTAARGCYKTDSGMRQEFFSVIPQSSSTK